MPQSADFDVSAKNAFSREVKEGGAMPASRHFESQSNLLSRRSERAFVRKREPKNPTVKAPFFVFEKNFKKFKKFFKKVLTFRKICGIM